jgi:hypothetical protein
VRERRKGKHPEKKWIKDHRDIEWTIKAKLYGCSIKIKSVTVLPFSTFSPAERSQKQFQAEIFL